MVAADDCIVTGKAVRHEPVRRATVELYAQAAIFRRMPWSGRQHLAIADFTAKRLRQCPQIGNHRSIAQCFADTLRSATLPSANLIQHFVHAAACARYSVPNGILFS
jgi:hypothetical protein